MSNSGNTVDLLKYVPMFQGLSRKQQKTLARSFVSRKFSDGEEIVKQGEAGLGIFIVITGQAEAIREFENGDKKPVNTFGPNDFFGELALLSDGTRTASVYARSEIECLALARWDFLPILKDDAEMAVSVAQELATRFRHTLDTIS